MAGTLEVTEELCWMPAGWIFDTVLDRIASRLSPQEPALAARLLAARTEVNGGYLDLRDVELETWASICHAAERAYHRLIQEGTQEGMTPEDFAGLLAQFQQLCDMFHTRQSSPLPQPQRHATRL